MKHRGAGVKATIQDQELGPCLVRTLARNRERFQKPSNQVTEPLCSREQDAHSGEQAQQTATGTVPAEFPVRNQFPKGLLLGPQELCNRAAVHYTAGQLSGVPNTGGSNYKSTAPMDSSVSRNQRGFCTCYVNIHSATELGPFPQLCVSKAVLLTQTYVCVCTHANTKLWCEDPTTDNLLPLLFRYWGVPQTSGPMLGVLASRNKLAALAMLNVSASACPRGRKKQPSQGHAAGPC